MSGDCLQSQLDHPPESMALPSHDRRFRVPDGLWSTRQLNKSKHFLVRYPQTAGVRKPGSDFIHNRGSSGYDISGTSAPKIFIGVSPR